MHLFFIFVQGYKQAECRWIIFVFSLARAFDFIDFRKIVNPFVSPATNGGTMTCLFFIGFDTSLLTIFIEDYGLHAEYRASIHTRIAKNEKSPYVLRLNQFPEHVALLQESMHCISSTSNPFQWNDPRDGYTYLVLCPCFGTRIPYQHTALVVCYRFELNRISFYAVSIDDIVLNIFESLALL